MTDQAHIRKEQVAGLYNRAAATYGKIGPDLFAPFGRDLVARMHLPPGARALDVATGRGAVLFAAAEQVGTAGFVVGIDVAEQMVQETAADLRERQMTNAAVKLMDAEHLAFPSTSFDAVLCSHALPLFPQVERALAEFHRVLHPGGKVGICMPDGGDERWLWYTQLIFAYAHTHHLSTEWVPRILDVSEVIRLLREVGFVGISTASQEYEFVYTTAQQWWEAQWTNAARFPLEGMPPAVLEQFKTDVFERLASFKQPDGFPYRRKASLLVGTKRLVAPEVETGKEKMLS
jgi:ubiquinone/menaquinone biosynthesis C-methylase UbiE